MNIYVNTTAMIHLIKVPVLRIIANVIIII